MHVVRYSLSVFLVKILTFVLGVVSSILITRILGPTERGIYSFVFLIPAMVLVFGDLGLGNANTYFTGKNRFNLGTIASNSVAFGLLNGCFLTILSIGILTLFQGHFPEIDFNLVYLILSVIPFSLVSTYYTGILLAKFKIRELNFLSILSSVGSLIGILLLVVCHGDVFELILLSILMNISVFIVLTLVMRRITSIGLSISLGPLKESMLFGIKTHLANVFSFLGYRLNIFLVAYYAGFTMLGYFSVAVGLAEMVWMVPSSVATILFPEISSRKLEDTGGITKMACRGLVFISAVLSLTLAIFGDRIIEIVFGTAFLPSYTPLLLLLPGISIMSISHVTGSYLPGIGKPIYSAIGSLLVLLTVTGLNITLLPELGLVGASIATTIGYISGSVYGLYMFLRFSKESLLDTIIVRPSDFQLYIRLLEERLRYYLPKKVNEG